VEREILTLLLLPFEDVVFRSTVSIVGRWWRRRRRAVCN